MLMHLDCKLITVEGSTTEFHDLHVYVCSFMHLNYMQTWMQRMSFRSWPWPKTNKNLPRCIYRPYSFLLEKNCRHVFYQPQFWNQQTADFGVGHVQKQQRLHWTFKWGIFEGTLRIHGTNYIYIYIWRSLNHSHRIHVWYIHLHENQWKINQIYMASQNKSHKIFFVYFPAI